MSDIKFKLDKEQQKILIELNKIRNGLEKLTFGKFFRKILFIDSKKINGLYIYGDVGRGKSMLLKEFYNSLNKTAKIYCHFNSFMKSIHEALRDIRSGQKKYNDQLEAAIDLAINPKLKYLSQYKDDESQNFKFKIKNIFNKEIKILCIDEFQVIDAADSMILSRVITYLYSKNIIVIFTSNTHPQDLYKDGIQAELFQDFVKDTLLPNSPAIKLTSDMDYRTKKTPSASQRFFVNDRYYDEELNNLIKELTNNKDCFTTRIKVWGREVSIDNSYFINNNDLTILNSTHNKQNKTASKNKIKNNKTSKFAIVTFDSICSNSFSAADYQAISQTFDLVILLKVPPLSKQDTNEARRLTLFIDEIYENKTSLITLSAKKIEEIYPAGIGSKSFLRTISRLKEIESYEYWQNSKINNLSLI
ncbi:MAG: hypothetical protein CMP18_02280 [Rickettsiales bacterium]|nr:hypothetical protein [Rickettsiales bacterium]|tara:strand:- start:8227 stop:9480 length:1254 start_codon:yes stop_codon:yes gene_type:complete